MISYVNHIVRYSPRQVPPNQGGNVGYPEVSEWSIVRSGSTFSGATKWIWTVLILTFLAGVTGHCGETGQRKLKRMASERLGILSAQAQAWEHALENAAIRDEKQQHRREDADTSSGDRRVILRNPHDLADD